jgi:hypothetical protein
MQASTRLADSVRGGGRVPFAAPGRRLAFEVGSSLCRRLRPGWVPRARYPWRPPLALADAVAPLLLDSLNRTLLVAAGQTADLAHCLEHVSPRVHTRTLLPAASSDSSRTARRRTSAAHAPGRHKQPALRSSCDPEMLALSPSPSDDEQLADVYVLRPSPHCAPQTAVVWVRWLAARAALDVRGTRARPIRVLVACELQWPPDVLVMHLLQRLPTTSGVRIERVERVHFDEEADEAARDGADGAHASLEAYPDTAERSFERLGQWGVVSLVHIELQRGTMSAGAGRESGAMSVGGGADGGMDAVKSSESAAATGGGVNADRPVGDVTDAGEAGRERARAAHSMPRDGLCGPTLYETEHVGECFVDEAKWRYAGTGMWSVGRTHYSMDARTTAPVLNNISSLADCVAMCTWLCPRCRFVSFSRANDDCSWYADCNMLNLMPSPGATGYVTVEVHK